MSVATPGSGKEFIASLMRGFFTSASRSTHINRRVFQGEP
uniref:AAA domain protein n=1 Tax=Siphoviridae sp. ctixZ6 TaxID=2826437 RepID=A0A8S5N6S5_9CAUD|nr:MAG TPA: AAA domain protein [Siphoviridae sp. ctixZ6]